MKIVALVQFASIHDASFRFLSFSNSSRWAFSTFSRSWISKFNCSIFSLIVNSALSLAVALRLIYQPSAINDVVILQVALPPRKEIDSPRGNNQTKEDRAYQIDTSDITGK